jgi:starvation-inducible outer membrane lipoprotein
VIKDIHHGPGERNLTIAQVPLNPAGHPKDEDPEGEFVGHTTQPLDPKIFHTGMKVTLAGEIERVEVKESGAEEDSLPVLRVIEIHAWAERKSGTFPLFRGWEINQYAPSFRPTMR